MREYTLIRSARRSTSLEVTRELTVLVRAPMQMPIREIDQFVEKHDTWINKHIQLQKKRMQSNPEPSEEEKQELIQRARKMLPQKVAYYAALMGVQPTGISITGARKRYGSCSAKNRLCFTWRLMRCPEVAIDSVVVHELAHIIHKNHGTKFYDLVRSILPDYDERKKMLEL